MPLYKYTTTVEALQTVSEIQRILVNHGARSILMDYGKDGSVEALAFKVMTLHGEVAIRLPVNADAVLKVLERECVPRRYTNKAQAVRVAWRILKEWVAAQMAIIETEMVTMDEVFLPYVLTSSGKTVYELAIDRGFKELGSRNE